MPRAVPRSGRAPALAAVAPRPEPLPYKVDRALLGFDVDSADIFSDDADADEVHAAEHEHRGEQRGVAGHVPAEDQYSHRDEERIGEAEQGDRAAEVGPDAQRHGAEAGDALEREVPQLPARELALAGDPRLAAVRHDRGAEAHP